jgi:hypothetical protein
MLTTAKLLDESAEEVVIYGIEPALVEQGEGLSEVLSSRMDEYIREILREFETV